MVSNVVSSATSQESDRGRPTTDTARCCYPDKAIATLQQQYGDRVLRTTLPDDIETQLMTAVNQPAKVAA